MTAKAVPVLLLTGFLGSGKTTLLNHLATEAATMEKMKLAVIENEYALAFGLEGKLLSEAAKGSLVDEIYEFGNGCVCCSMKGEFTNALYALANSEKKFDLLIVELTGMADPEGVARLFDKDLSTHFYLHTIVTVVDSRNILQELDRGFYKKELPGGDFVKNEAVNQIVSADVIVLNKIDLVSPSELDLLRSKVSSLNPTASVVSSLYSAVEFGSLVSLTHPPTPSPALLRIHATTPGPLSIHDPSIVTAAATSTVPLQPEQVPRVKERLMEMMQGSSVDIDPLSSSFAEENATGSSILRLKGIMYLKDNTTITIQGVQQLLSFSDPQLDSEDGGRKVSVIVAIGRNLSQSQFEKIFE
eukprot:TRINITY_DN156_c2_g1_i2.p1 TRINITY_DN156_c2_g1~~TRINITY_DN156_c2_g1_i2.p1  ORF type:complete len:377 (+),score=90.02 TRINITY_DN156_c2_g1_i2:58-1131(+)